MIFQTQVHKIHYTEVEILNEQELRDLVKDFVKSAFMPIPSCFLLDVDVCMIVNDIEYNILY
jgi:ferredoxin-fold anticodon binding domain-containing protein